MIGLGGLLKEREDPKFVANDFTCNTPSSVIPFFRFRIDVAQKYRKEK